MTTLTGIKSKNGLKILGHIGALVTVSAWGSSFICTKVLMESGGFSPIEMYVYRFAMAYLVLLLFTFRKIASNSWRDELQFLLAGICCGSLYFITENYALQNTTIANVSLLSSLSPILTTIMVAVIFGTRIGKGVILGSLVAAAGVGCVVFSHGEGFELNPLGDILALSSAFSWAVYSILVKRLMPSYSTFFITRKLFFYGVVSALPLFFATQHEYHLMLLFDLSQPKFIINFLFLVVMCSIVGFLIWNEVMRILGPVTANNYLYMQPLVTLVVAYFVFDEKIFLNGYLGCILIIGGLIIADKWNPRVRVRFPLRTFKQRKSD